MSNHRPLSRLSTLGFLALGCVALGHAQTAPQFGFDYDGACIDPDNTMPYSRDINTYIVQNDLWGAGMGVSGTVAYDEGCPVGDPLTVNVRGRLGLTVGPTGSIQDDTEGRFVDNFLRLNWGMNSNDAGPFDGIIAGGFRARSGEGWTFARYFREDADGTGRTSTLFGASPMSLAFIGASDRYFLMEQATTDGVRASCRVDVVGDAARVNWRLRNETANTLRLGLWYGHWVIFAQADTGPIGRRPYITVPGRRPITTHRRYTRSTDPAGFPNAVAFGLTQRDAFGLQVVNGAIGNNPFGTTTNGEENIVPDQTPVDEFVIGDVDNTLSGVGENDDPQFGDFIFDFDGDGVGEASIDFDASFIQKWETVQVDPPVPGDTNSGVREIVTYYRSTWGASQYNQPYSVVVDAPKALDTNPADPTVFAKDTFPLRVYVDNVQGFATVDRTVPLNDVRITLELPDGITTIGPAQKTISTVNPRQMGSVDFTIQVSPEVFGELNYAVRVESFPGPTTRVSGTIVVPSTPRLSIRDGANLVGDPFEHDTPSWDTILAPLQLNVDFQAYTWDPQQGGYIVQSGPERGIGTWIVSRTDAGLKVLQGGPRQPADFTNPAGPPLVRVRAGWNLIANPYNYSFPIGQIVGVAGANNRRSFTFSDLVRQGFISGSLVFWDNVNRTYVTLPSDQNTRLQPNRGYWIFVQTAEPLDISFPPIFEPFVGGGGGAIGGTNRPLPPAAPAAPAGRSTWSLQLTAKSNRAADTQNFVGLAPTAADAKALRVYEAPIAPVAGAVALSFEDKSVGARLTQAFTQDKGRQEWVVKVQSRESGLVTLGWPNLSSLPKKASVQLVDVKTKTVKDLRKTTSYRFQAEAGIREFRLIIDPSGVGTIRQSLIGSLSASGRASSSKGGTLNIRYQLNAETSNTLRVLSGGREVIALVRDVKKSAGGHTAKWDLRDASGNTVKPGRYRIEIVASSGDGATDRREVSVTVSR